MKIEMNDQGGIDLMDIDVDQICLLAQSLEESSNQQFMEDPELNKMIKLLSILKSDLFSDLGTGKIDFTQFKMT